MRDLLLISDLHLGSHLKPRSRGEYVHLAARIEEVFPRFLDYYRESGRWLLVVNGDFIDFWNVEEGEGATDEDVAVHRLHMVFDEYPGVEDAFVRFLEAGHGIVFVAGNHDAEFLYPAVRRALIERLEGKVDADDASITRTSMTRLDDMGAKVRVVEWFLREEGGAWIEHGHLFDSACRTDNPLSPTRRGQLVKTVAEVATRRFTNLMPEIDYDAPDKFTTRDYLAWAAARGWRFLMRAVLLYLRMVGHMLGLWIRGARVDTSGEAEHERRLSKIAGNAGLQMSALTALQNMAPPPSTATIGGVLSVTHMDYFLSALVPLVALPWLSLSLGAPAWAAFLLGALGAALVIRGVARRREPRDIHRDMLHVASDVGRLVGAPLVLMGHSHHGSIERRGDVVYGNSGSWLDGSHLVVTRDETGQLDHLELRRWRNGGVMVLDETDVFADVVRDAASAHVADDALSPVPAE